MAARLPIYLLRGTNKLNIWSFRQQCRSYLSASYQCQDIWNQRLNHPLLKDIKPTEYFYDMDQKYKHEGKVTAIDVDLFVNSLQSQSNTTPSEVEEIIHRLRRSRESIHTLPSTHHATLRYLLKDGANDMVLKFLSDPMNYGIFPDHYTANILMDSYLQDKNFTGAARVASWLMLQEDFGPPLTQALALASAYSYVNTEDNLPWQDYKQKLEEPEEEVKIRRKYLRNPYFDDHFDLSDPNHLVGKTLAWLCPKVGGSIGISGELLGWALYEKWAEFEEAVLRIKGGSDPIAKSVVEKVKQILESSENPEEVKGALEAITQLEKSPVKIAEIDMAAEIDKIVKETVILAQESDIKHQTEIFKAWERRREEEFEKQLAEYHKKKMMAEIEEKKKDLAKKEQVIYFFDNQDKLEMLAPKNWMFRKRKRSKIFKDRKSKTKLDSEDYIPPTVR